LRHHFQTNGQTLQHTIVKPLGNPNGQVPGFFHEAYRSHGVANPFFMYIKTPTRVPISRQHHPLAIGVPTPLEGDLGVAALKAAAHRSACKGEGAVTSQHWRSRAGAWVSEIPRTSTSLKHPLHPFCLCPPHLHPPNAIAHLPTRATRGAWPLVSKNQ
jgi:hypothetical protein